MKTFALLLVLFAVPAFAQTTKVGNFNCTPSGSGVVCSPIAAAKSAPQEPSVAAASSSSTTSATPTVNRFSVSGKAFGYTGAGTSLVAADAVATVGVTPAFSLRSDNIMLSSAATTATGASIAEFFLDGIQYQLPFKLSGTSLSGVSFYTAAQLGVENSAVNNSYAGSVALGASYCPRTDSSVCVNLGEVRAMYGAVPVGVTPSGINRFAHWGIGYSVGLTF